VSGLACLSVGSLAELADELQRCVHEYSEELVAELARRDELDFEKELKNQFIWLLLRVQRRRRQLSQLESRAAVTGVHKTTLDNAEVTHRPHRHRHGHRHILCTMHDPCTDPTNLTVD